MKDRRSADCVIVLNYLRRLAMKGARSSSRWKSSHCEQMLIWALKPIQVQVRSKQWTEASICHMGQITSALESSFPDLEPGPSIFEKVNSLSKALRARRVNTNPKCRKYKMQKKPNLKFSQLRLCGKHQLSHLVYSDTCFRNITVKKPLFKSHKNGLAAGIFIPPLPTGNRCALHPKMLIFGRWPPTVGWKRLITQKTGYPGG